MTFSEKDILFSRKICVDLFSLHGDTIFHIFGKDAKFGAAEFLAGGSVKDVWRTYYGLRASNYVSHLIEMQADTGPQF